MMRRRMIIALACAGSICLGPVPQVWAQRGGGLGGRGGSVRFAARVVVHQNDDDEPWNAGFGGGGSNDTGGSKQIATVNSSVGTSGRGAARDRSRINYGSIQNASSESSGSVESSSNPVWLLVGMSNYLADLQQLTLWITMTSERATESGQKVQVTNQQITYLQRPDKLAVDVNADKARTRIVCDGAGTTCIDLTRNLYGTIPVQGALDSVLDTLAREYGMAVPADDLLYKGAYARIKDKIKSAEDLGVETIDGRVCYHVAFSGDKVDAQIWFESGDAPMPRKVVIIYKNEPGRPRCKLEITRWEIAPLPASVFKAEVPAGARQIKILPR